MESQSFTFGSFNVNVPGFSPSENIPVTRIAITPAKGPIDDAEATRSATILVSTFRNVLPLGTIGAVYELLGELVAQNNESASSLVDKYYYLAKLMPDFDADARIVALLASISQIDTQVQLDAFYKVAHKSVDAAISAMELLSGQSCETSSPHAAMSAASRTVCDQL